MDTSAADRTQFEHSKISQHLRRALIVVIALGFAARIGLSWVSIGSVDAYLWEKFGSQINRIGLYDTYRFEPWMNHPPLPGEYSAAIFRLAATTGIRFSVLFRIPTILADGAACLLLYFIYRGRASKNAEYAGLVAAALFAWNINALLMSGFHCNTDSIYSMLCIAAIWLADTKSRPFLAGIALGAAINVKVLPGMFILPLLLLSRSWKEFFRIVLGLAVMSLPFLWMLYDLRNPFTLRVLRYRPMGGSGICDILMSLLDHPILHPYLRGVVDRYIDAAKPLVLMGTALPALALRRNGNWNRYQAFALAGVVFAVISPGFAIHYTAMVGAVLFAYDLRAGVIWGFLTGLQLLTFYLFLWNGQFPIAAQQPLEFAGPSKYFEMLAFGWAVSWLVRQYSSSFSKKKEAVGDSIGSDHLS